MILLQHLAPDAGFPLANCRGSVNVDASGLYVVHDQGRPLYVGMSMQLGRRLSRAVTSSHHALPAVFRQHPAARVVLLEFPWWTVPQDDLTDEQYLWRIRWALSQAENQAIAFYRPTFNRPPGRPWRPL